MLPIHKDGWRFIAIFAVITVVLLWLWRPLGWLGVLATSWCIYFFRDPWRVSPQRDGLVLSPADGRIIIVDESVPPPELGFGSEPMQRIAIFMSVFDVHVNRAPMAGHVARLAYTEGKFVNASLDKASIDNERMAIRLSTPQGDIGVTQIAGLVARRIVIDPARRARGHRRPAHRPHPLRQPCRGLSAARLGGAGDRRDSALSAARPCSPMRMRKSRRAAGRSTEEEEALSDEAPTPAPASPRQADPRLVVQQDDPEHPDPARAVRRDDRDPLRRSRSITAQAVVAIIVAGVFDGIDGRIARLLKGTSEFGAELDSLSDFVSFGVAPALLMYLWSVQSLSSLGWIDRAALRRVLRAAPRALQHPDRRRSAALRL